LSELQIGEGAWFRESSAALRLGFGYLPINVLSGRIGCAKPGLRDEGERLELQVIDPFNNRIRFMELKNR
jgi:hypothetical protein